MGARLRRMRALMGRQKDVLSSLLTVGLHGDGLIHLGIKRARAGFIILQGENRYTLNWWEITPTKGVDSLGPGAQLGCPRRARAGSRETRTGDDGRQETRGETGEGVDAGWEMDRPEDRPQNLLGRTPELRSSYVRVVRLG